MESGIVAVVEVDEVVEVTEVTTAGEVIEVIAVDEVVEADEVIEVEAGAVAADLLKSTCDLLFKLHPSQLHGARQKKESSVEKKLGLTMKQLVLFSTDGQAWKALTSDMYDVLWCINYLMCWDVHVWDSGYTLRPDSQVADFLFERIGEKNGQTAYR